MRFAPKSEQELDARTLLPKNEYDASVETAADEISKSSGNEQIHLLLRVKSPDGRQNLVHDYLLEKMGAKLRHFCESAGLLSEYESGELTAAHCSGMDVRVRLDIEQGQNGYADKNIVKDYVAKAKGVAPPTRQSAPSNSPASPEGSAKKAWLVVWNRFVGEFPNEAAKRDVTWDQCFKSYFPGKDPKRLSAAEWRKFQVDVAKWDPINGWPKPAAVGAPFGDEQQFSEDDIPF